MTEAVNGQQPGLDTAREVAKAFKANGIPYLFGIPGGGSSIDLIEACRAEKIPFVLTQHETTAALMAVVCGELTGSCGACISIMAPGAANLTPGTTYAFLERHPLLCITECYGSEYADKMTLQKIDHQSIFDSTCKTSVTIGPTEPGLQITDAIKLSSTERPGPVHIDFPMDLSPVATGQTNREPISQPLTGDLEAISLAVDRAKKPIVIAGPVVARQNAQDSLVALAEKIQAAVMVTSKARGVIAEDNPLYAGVMSGVYRTDTLEGEMMGKSDLILAVGLDAAELLSPWKYTHPILSLDAITVPKNEQVGDPTHTASGPMSEVLNQISELVKSRDTWSSKEISEYWNRALGVLGAFRNDLNAASVLTRARNLTPRETIVTTEAGVYGRVNLYVWKAYQSGTYFDSSGANTMGYSLPAGIAASLVKPNQKTVSLVGDGGFLMRAGELETAARLKLSPVIIVFDDGTLGMIRVKQRVKGYAREGVDLTQTNFVKLTESFGGQGYEVNTLDQFDSAFKSALESDKLSVIDVRVEPETYLSHYTPIRGL